MSVSYNVTTTPSSGATTSLPLSQKSVSELWVLVQSQGLSAASALLMHGVFILLFILALSYLFRTYPDGYRIPGRTFLRLTAILLAVFAVVQVVLDVSLVILIANVLTGKVTRGSAPRMLMWTYRMLYLARQGSLAVNNLIADILFLYRCKRIWGTHRLTPYIITFVSFLIIGTAAIAGVTIYYKLNIRIPFGAALGTNVVLLVLTAGRIWYKGRRAEPLMGRRLRTRWRAAVAIILESSLLYVAANMLYMISQTRNVPPFTGAQSICWGALAQLVTEYYTHDDDCPRCSQPQR
ncbi:hypothetical protein MIND_01231700 [Mycena indigotica]|uniref:Uncharacterized protein n=1 Tax=Mycena indigotica TaxID=2126181 RepID=A0A8H6S3G7_9AGAR|nr:uncharacterized protein MIND_01231700 [Mycena indigotica]KAF7292056.1 hypothetical protein MIND_01231700 [Mycena indigotica]